MPGSRAPLRPQGESKSPELLELVVFAGDEVEICKLPAEGRLALGRSADNDLRIDHPSVSRRHGLLHVGPPLRFQDLGSANGTFVRDRARNGAPGETDGVRRISAESVEVTVGERIMLGSVVLVVRRRRRSVPPAKAAGGGDLSGGVVAHDPETRALHEKAARTALTNVSVLLLGETGVGKEVLARTIHRWSKRADKVLLPINCAALSESLLEGELFGYERGAFTGASEPRAGLFEAANGGTVFLDEIGELSPAVQAKLLRLLEDSHILRIGARAPRTVDVRIVSATNRDLEAEVAAGRFRKDLYYRLSGATLTLPPLRERRGDIAPLVEAFAARASRELDRARVARISSRAMAALKKYAWPGNVRELRSMVELAVALAPGDVLGLEQFPSRLFGPAPKARPSLEGGDVDTQRASQLWEQVGAVERQRILRALEACSGNQTRAAEMLGIARRTLVARLGRYGLTRPRKKGSGEAGDS